MLPRMAFGLGMAFGLALAGPFLRLRVDSYGSTMEFNREQKFYTQFDSRLARLEYFPNIVLAI